MNGPSGKSREYAQLPERAATALERYRTVIEPLSDGWRSFPVGTLRRNIAPFASPANWSDSVSVNYERKPSNSQRNTVSFLRDSWA